jgi:hypothetical protein
MSRQNNTNNKKTQQILKYCKVCHDAGKPESEYRSHFLRDSTAPNSKIVCPTLLALECRYCYKNGHTVKYCSVLKDNEKQLKSQQNQNTTIQKDKKQEKQLHQKVKGVSNIFDAFNSDSDEEKEKEEEEEQKYAKTSTHPNRGNNNKNDNKNENASITFKSSVEFPALFTTTTKQATNNNNNNNNSNNKKQVNKPQFMSALKQICPELSITSKMPDVEIAKKPMATLVRDQPTTSISESGGCAAMRAPSTSVSISDYISTAPYNRPLMKASEMNWAAMDSDSDSDYDNTNNEDDDENW